jgi:hypothetical protein
MDAEAERASAGVSGRGLAPEIGRTLRSLPNPNAQAIRAVRREYSKRVAGEPARSVIDLSLELLKRPAPGHRFVACELIMCHPAALAAVGARDLARLGEGMASWSDVDTFGCCVAGHVWREGQVSDRLIHRWARSSDRWWRRAALVATVPLNVKARGGSGDTERTLAVCRLLLDDRDDMVVKGMSWALRALAERDPKGVRRFIREHEGVLAPRVLREVRNKLTTGLKNPGRCGTRG